LRTLRGKKKTFVVVRDPFSPVPMDGKKNSKGGREERRRALLPSREVKLSISHIPKAPLRSALRGKGDD